MAARPEPAPTAVSGPEFRLTAADAVRVARAVPDPELPFLDLGDLGVIDGALIEGPQQVRVRFTPTFLGCPATDVIKADVRAALLAAGWRTVEVELRLDPPWTPDSITAAGREKLAAQGIAPPTGSRAATGSGPGRPAGSVPVSVQVTPFPGPGLAARTGPAPACPHCAAAGTVRLSAFGPTPCQELRRCSACGEPFTAIKSRPV